MILFGFFYSILLLKTLSIITGGINCVTTKLVDSYAACPDSSNGIITSVLKSLSSTSSSWQGGTSSGSSGDSLTLSQLTSSEAAGRGPLINFAPLGM